MVDLELNDNSESPQPGDRVATTQPTPSETVTAKRPAPPKSKSAPESLLENKQVRRWGDLIRGQVVRTAFSPILNLFACLPLGFAVIFLVAAWQAAPERLVVKSRLQKLTQPAAGKIVESWVAIELNPKEVGTHANWKPFSKVSRCAVVQYEGAWGATAKRAFCGYQFPFDSLFLIPESRDLATGVPFTWMRDGDGNGFMVPEVRVSAEAHQWMSTHPDDFAWPNQPPPPTALAAVKLALDRPVDDIVAGWSLAVPAFPLLLDPKDPAGALPAGYVARQLDQGPSPGSWIGFVVFSAIGLFVWLETLGFILGAMPRWAFWVVALIPLSTLPWWVEKAPGALRHLNDKAGQIFALMLNDLTKADRLLATGPDSATLAHGDRLLWNAGEGVYTDTFWKVALPLESTRPAPVEFPITDKKAMSDASDAALADLAELVTRHFATQTADEKTTLFRRLEQDLKDKKLRVGVVFLRSAKLAIVDPQSPPALARAAHDFLWAWVLAGIDTDARELATGERWRLRCELVDVPVPEVANMLGDCRAPTPTG